MKRKRLISLMFALVALAGCKKYAVECDLVVQPYLMVAQGSDPHAPAYKARVYAYYVGYKDALDMNWRPSSYADADAGVIRHRTTGEVRSYSRMGEQDHSAERIDDYIHIPLTSSPVVLVAVDPVNRFYAYRRFEYKIPIEKILVPVTFKVWLWEQPYKENEWTVISERSENPAREEEPAQEEESIQQGR